MFTQPDDLAEGSIGDVLLAGWGFMASSVEYQAVGFGSHHWLATDARGARLFVTVDDLSAKRREPRTGHIWMHGAERPRRGEWEV